MGQEISFGARPGEVHEPHGGASFAVRAQPVNGQDMANAGRQSPNTMDERRRHRLKRNRRNEVPLRLEQDDGSTRHPSLGVFDLVVTHFILVCFRRGELERVVAVEEG